MRMFISPEDRWITYIWLFILLISGIIAGVNFFHYHFTGIFYVPTRWLISLPFVVILTIFSCYTRYQSQKVSFVIRNYGSYFITIIALGILTTSIQYTPFQTIDPFLTKLDRLMGVDFLAILNWVNTHYFAKKILHFSYFTIGPQLIFVPLIICLLQDQEGIRVYLYAILYSFIIGAMCYYFFPSIGPASVFNSHFFTADQIAPNIKFFETHHFFKLTTNEGGLIAFPSFHATWAVILTAVCYKHRWLFYSLVLLNTVVIAATVLLGWHYVVDVIGGIFLAWLGIWLGIISNRYLVESSDFTTRS